MTSDYEKLGAFYLGKEYDIQDRSIKDDLVLYDSKDLTTHAVIIGMTGSGKTGLGIGLIEEALIDNIPVIAIDPKGDLSNLMLTFPSLSAEEFAPWINPQDAAKKGQKPEQYARSQAETWKKGLADWGQTPERVARLKEAAECVVYTPGSSAGIPVSVLKTFAPPSLEIQEDSDFMRERIRTTTTGILALLGIDADPITSKEHILIANIFEFFWSQGKGLELGSLIHALQSPPFERIGVMDLELFYPEKERFGLAMKLNSLLASPGFEVWLKGAPLHIQDLLYTKQGKPKASIFTISHLGDKERMFFVTILLNEILGWMRMQPGTTSLRALLYIDELFGYLPPVQNPPSKIPLLTLLKQARAYGLGVVLSTQNPVDLDYKGLSNTGTWFIGRLQTKRDKERLLAGLEGVDIGTTFDRNKVEEILSSLGKRVFYLHNVHETGPVLFHTRWVLSYLAGPLSREQIKLLMKDKTSSVTSPEKQGPTQHPAAGPESLDTLPPVTPPGIDTFYLRASGAGQSLVYFPALLGRIDIQYTHLKHNINESRTRAFMAEFSEGPVVFDWDNAVKVDPTGIETSPITGATFSELLSEARNTKNHRKWSKDFYRWVSNNHPLTLYHSKRFKETSLPAETESDFRVRLTLHAREQRDLDVEKIRQKYNSKFTKLKDRLLRAEQAIMREQEQSKSRTVQTAVSFGTAILSAFLGRKAVSVSSASRLGSALKSASRIQKERLDVNRARERADSVREQLAVLEQRFRDDIARIEISLDPATEPLREISVKPKQTQMTLELFGICWMPYRKDDGGKINPDWQ